MAKLKGIPDVSESDITRSNFSQLVKKYTGMDASVNLEKGSWAAAVHLVQIDKNHVLFQQRSSWLAYATSNRESKSISEIGGVNLATAKVTGIFTECPIKVILGTNFFNGYNTDKEAIQYFTPEEIAAIILHELGHAFSTFEYLGSTVMTGLLISSTVRAAMDIPPGPARTKVVMTACEDTDTKVSEDFVQSALDKFGENADAVILSERIQQGAKLTKTSNYDARNFEQMADQFAVKHGVGPSLASGLEKLERLGWNINYRHPVTYAMFECMKIAYAVIGVTSGFVLFPPLGLYNLVIVLSHVCETKIYDDPKDRFIRMKQDLISELRVIDAETPQNKALRATIISSIELIEGQIRTVNDRESVSKALWNVLTPWGKNRAQQEQKQKMLEAALNNELHLKSAQLKSL